MSAGIPQGRKAGLCRVKPEPSSVEPPAEQERIDSQHGALNQEFDAQCRRKPGWLCFPREVKRGPARTDSPGTKTFFEWFPQPPRAPIFVTPRWVRRCSPSAAHRGTNFLQPKCVRARSRYNEGVPSAAPMRPETFSTRVALLLAAPSRKSRITRGSRHWRASSTPSEVSTCPPDTSIRNATPVGMWQRSHRRLRSSLVGATSPLRR